MKRENGSSPHRCCLHHLLLLCAWQRSQLGRSAANQDADIQIKEGQPPLLPACFALLLQASRLDLSLTHTHSERAAALIYLKVTANNNPVLLLIFPHCHWWINPSSVCCHKQHRQQPNGSATCYHNKQEEATCSVPLAAWNGRNDTIPFRVRTVRWHGWHWWRTL